MVFGTSHSKENPNYGGGHLFRDLVESMEVQVEVETNEGKSFTKAIRLENITPMHASSPPATPSRTMWSS